MFTFEAFSKHMKKVKLAVICQNDTLWSLYAWNNVFKRTDIKSKYDIVGFWICDEKFANIKQADVWKWYLRTFGFFNFLKLSFFAVFFKITSVVKKVLGNYALSFESLCEESEIPFFKTTSPNSEHFVDWVKKENIDVLVIMVGHILKKPVLSSVNKCVINKHAALLPANKGVFPYFWAKMKNEPQGVSFHTVDEKIDEGELLYQESITDTSFLRSMIAFYFCVYKNYHRFIIDALFNAEKEHFILKDKNVMESYHGLPDKNSYKVFRKNGGSVISLSDLLLPFKI